MSYYGQGDYYAAGGIGSFLKKAAGFVGEALLPSPVRSVISLGSSLLNRSPSGGNAGGSQFPPQINLPGPLVFQSPIAVQRQQTDRLSLDLPSFAADAGGIPPRGYHLNKTAYFLRDGTFVPARSRYVRNRSRNNANGRALRRAIGRVSGFNDTVKRSRKSLKALASI